MLDWLPIHARARARRRRGVIRNLLAWIELWFASAAGAWNEPLVDVAWCGALAAFAFAAYGYWRALGLASWLALALVYGLVSLPLIDAHVALAGYADLWLALTLGLATLAWVRWIIDGERGQLALATCLALCLPAIKIEGMVWLLCSAPSSRSISCRDAGAGRARRASRSCSSPACSSPARSGRSQVR